MHDLPNTFAMMVAILSFIYELVYDSYIGAMISLSVLAARPLIPDDKELPQNREDSSDQCVSNDNFHLIKQSLLENQQIHSRSVLDDKFILLLCRIKHFEEESYSKQVIQKYSKSI